MVKKELAISGKEYVPFVDVRFLQYFGMTVHAKLNLATTAQRNDQTM